MQNLKVIDGREFFGDEVWESLIDRDDELKPDEWQYNLVTQDTIRRLLDTMEVADAIRNRLEELPDDVLIDWAD